MILMLASSPVIAEEYIVRMITDTENARYYFEPAALTIKNGDTVKWINARKDFHNAAADSVPMGADFFESPMLEQEGESWSHTFTISGSYSYHCHPHAAMGMIGMIVVDYTSIPDDIQKKGEISGHEKGHDHGG